MKRCRRCGEEKPFLEFRNGFDLRRQKICRACRDEIDAVYEARCKKRLSKMIIKRQKERYANDPAFNFIQRVRRRMRSAIKDKAKSSLELLGCTGEEAYEYIKSQFTEDMTEEAFMRGEIHIDHIKPISSFNLTDPKEQARCFHYTNLQPLWAEDNLRKGNKTLDI